MSSKSPSCHEINTGVLVNRALIPLETTRNFLNVSGEIIEKLTRCFSRTRKPEPSPVVSAEPESEMPLPVGAKAYRIGHCSLNLARNYGIVQTQIIGSSADIAGPHDGGGPNGGLANRDFFGSCTRMSARFFARVTAL